MGEAIYDSLLSTIGQFKYNKRYNQVTDTDNTINPSEGPIDDKTITIRTLGVTFESIYQNIASYPNTIDMSNPDYLKKTFFLENDQKIYVNIDLRVDGKVITTITGDTSLADEGLTKTVVYNDIKIDTVYGVL